MRTRDLIPTRVHRDCLGSLEWGHHMLDLAGGGKSYAIEDVVSATLVGAIGLRVGPAAFELGVSRPTASSAIRPSRCR